MLDIRRAASVRQFLEGAQFVTSVLSVLIDEYGTECLAWDSETIRRDLLDDCNMSADQGLIDKFQAGAAILTTDQLYDNVHTFNVLALTLNGEDPAFEAFSPVTVEQAAWAMVEAQLLIGDDFRPERFSSHVNTYLGVLLHDSGAMDGHALFPSADMAAGPSEEDPDAAFADVRLTKNQGAREDIESYVSSRFAALLREMKTAPLINGAENWRKKLDKLLSNVTAGAS